MNAVRKGFMILFLSLLLFLTACSGEQAQKESAAPTEQARAASGAAAEETAQPTAAPVTQAAEDATAAQKEETQGLMNEMTEYPAEQPAALQMTIGDAPVSVAWEDNDAVQALKELCRDQPLTISMSMYGGFEQVGAIGSDLPRNDVQTATAAGDIVLYSGNQMVVFYGSNTWAYTRLGHITDKTTEELTQLLSNGDTVITITFG